MDHIHVGRSPEHIQSCKPHSHPFWEIVIPVFGQGVVETPNWQATFYPGLIYITPPNTLHWLHSDQDFSDIYIHLNGRDPHLNLTELTAIAELPQFPQLGELIWACYQKRDQGYEASVNRTLDLILQLIQDLTADDSRHTLPGKIREYLTENLSDPLLDMTQVSQVLGYSADYLRREFHQCFGETPMAFLAVQRLQRAQELLCYMPVFSVHDISELCGFADQFYFSRFFKKKTGLSPREFRQLYATDSR